LLYHSWSCIQSIKDAASWPYYYFVRAVAIAAIPMIILLRSMQGKSGAGQI
jgi:hypothetical protein